MNESNAIDKILFDLLQFKFNFLISYSRQSTYWIHSHDAKYIYWKCLVNLTVCVQYIPLLAILLLIKARYHYSGVFCIFGSTLTLLNLGFLVAVHDCRAATAIVISIAIAIAVVVVIVVSFRLALPVLGPVPNRFRLDLASSNVPQIPWDICTALFSNPNWYLFQHHDYRNS